MSNRSLPKPFAFTILLDGVQPIDAVIGLSGRVLLDHGEAAHRVIALMQQAPAAAAVGDSLVLSMGAGFRFVGRVNPMIEVGTTCFIKVLP